MVKWSLKVAPFPVMPIRSMPNKVSKYLAGNGAALRVVYNQRDMGLLGGFGQIASFIYTADEVLVSRRRTVLSHATLTHLSILSPTPIDHTFTYDYLHSSNDLPSTSTRPTPAGTSNSGQCEQTTVNR